MTHSRLLLKPEAYATGGDGKGCYVKRLTISTVAAITQIRHVHTMRVVMYRVKKRKHKQKAQPNAGPTKSLL